MYHALKIIRDYPANANSDPDVMAEALTAIHTIASKALAKPELGFESLVEHLESLVDSNNLRTVLEALASACDQKAEHLRVNWQDYSAAKDWDKAANKIDRCSNVPV